MVYDTNISLTKGEPFGSTVLISLNIYREAFNNNNYATGQAEAFLLFIIIAAISVTQVYIGKHCTAFLYGVFFGLFILQSLKSLNDVFHY